MATAKKTTTTSTAKKVAKTAAKAANITNSMEMKESPNTGRILGNGGVLPVSKTQKL